MDERSGARVGFSTLVGLVPISVDEFVCPALPLGTGVMFGGQLLAQALHAASVTVVGDRLPHSLHAYFLRPGDCSRPVRLHVERARDGRSYSVRRVVARQDGRTVLTLASSFQAPEGGPSEQVLEAPPARAPERCPPHDFPHLVSFEARVPEQPRTGLDRPTRLWVRCTADLAATPKLQPAAVAYISDVYTGLTSLNRPEHRAGASVDHTLWFHEPIDPAAWHLLDLAPVLVGRGRGFYRGTMSDRQGRIVASIAQESLFRPTRPATVPTMRPG